MTETPFVLHAYIRGLKTHDIATIGDAVAEDLAFVRPDRTLDKSQFLDMLRALYAAFPDWRYEHAEPEVRRDLIAIKWRQGGTHTGTLEIPGFDPILPTGRVVNIPAQYFFYRIRGEQIVEIRPDPIPGGAPLGILTQIGSGSKTPPPGCGSAEN